MIRSDVVSNLEGVRAVGGFPPNTIQLLQTFCGSEENKRQGDACETYPPSVGVPPVIFGNLRSEDRSQPSNHPESLKDEIHHESKPDPVGVGRGATEIRLEPVTPSTIVIGRSSVRGKPSGTRADAGSGSDCVGGLQFESRKN